MKVNSQPFPSVNMVEWVDRAYAGQNFTFDINMAGPARHRDEKKDTADSSRRPQADERQYVTEEQVRHIRYQRPASKHLLKKYEYQYKQHRQYESEDEEYERRTGRSLERPGDTRDHWHCRFFQYCWNSGMSRLPTINNCPECGRKGSVFQRLGPLPR